MRLLRLCLLTLMFFNALPLWAQVKFSTTVSDKEIGKDDYLQVQFTVENASSVESITAPSFSHFTVISGPMQQSGMSITNGVMSKSQGLSYTLKPQGTGHFTIYGAVAIVDGKQMNSNPVSVTVTNDPPKTSNPAAGNPFFGLGLPEEVPDVNEEYVLKKGDRATDKIKDNLFVKLDVSKTNCYVGEPIVAVYKLYSRLKSESRVTKRPSLSQFSVYDMVQPEANNPAVEKIKGQLFNVHIIRKVQLYALQDGSFELDPVEVDNTVHFLRLESGNNRTPLQQLMDDYLNGISNGKMEEEKITLSSKPVTIVVKPLPVTGRPADFDGAVGRFTISASLPNRNLRTNETATLDVQIKGQGNIPMINAPEIKWPDGTEGFEPAVKEEADKSVAPINGSKLFQYSFTPKHTGTLVIPAVELSYFDAAANAYKTVHTEAITVQVEQGRKNPAPASPTVIQEKIGNELPPASFWKWLAWLVIPLLALVAFFMADRSRKSRIVKKAVKPTKSSPVENVPLPPARFTAAGIALSAVNSQLFYRETGKAVWDMLREKFNLDSSQLNKRYVLRLMNEKAYPVETLHLVEEVLRDCELALYSPVHTESDMRLTLEKAKELEQKLFKG